MGAVTGYVIGNKMTNAVEAWSEAAQARNDETSKLAPEIKGVKILGLEKQVILYMRQFQERETLSWRTVRYYGLLTWMSCTSINGAASMPQY